MTSSERDTLGAQIMDTVLQSYGNYQEALKLFMSSSDAPQDVSHFVAQVWSSRTQFINNCSFYSQEEAMDIYVRTLKTSFDEMTKIIQKNISEAQNIEDSILSQINTILHQAWTQEENDRKVKPSYPLEYVPVGMPTNGSSFVQTHLPGGSPNWEIGY